MHFYEKFSGMKSYELGYETEVYHAIECRVDVDPRLDNIQMQWYFNDVLLEIEPEVFSPANKYDVSSHRVHHTHNFHLGIRNIAYTDVGVYSCLVNASYLSLHYSRNYDIKFRIECK